MFFNCLAGYTRSGIGITSKINSNTRPPVCFPVAVYCLPWFIDEGQKCQQFGVISTSFTKTGAGLGVRLVLIHFIKTPFGSEYRFLTPLLHFPFLSSIPLHKAFLTANQVGG